MTKKEQLLNYLDELRIKLKNPNIAVVEFKEEIIPEHKDVMVGDRKIGRVPVSKEYNIRIKIRD